MSQNTTEPQGYRLTFAELEMLNGDEAGWPVARSIIGFDTPVDSGIIRGCGLASLLARQYATIENDNVLVADSLIEVAKRLREATKWTGVTVVTQGQVAATLYGLNQSGTGRVYVAGVLPGVIEVLGFTNQTAPVDQLEAIILDDLAIPDVYVTVKAFGIDQNLTIWCHDDQWSLGDATKPDATYVPSTKEDALGSLHDILVAQLG